MTMGKQLRKIARRSRRVVAGWPKMSRETVLSIIFPPRHVSVLTRDESADFYVIDDATDFARGREKYAAITGRKG